MGTDRDTVRVAFLELCALGGSVGFEIRLPVGVGHFTATFARQAAEVLRENPDILLQVMYDQAAEEAELLARLEKELTAQ